jgi:hypothetical protein
MNEEQRLFTPRLGTGRRVAMHLDQHDMQMVDGHGRRPGLIGVVTDQKTDRRYRVYGAGCTLANCLCDVVAIPVDSEKVA